MKYALQRYSPRQKHSGSSPSPGTPGEGRGEGDLECRTAFAARNHPDPLPGYRERGPLRGSRHTGRTILAAVCFLFLFSVLLVLVFHFYLQPGLEAAKHMTAAQKHKQAAYASLLMTVLLTILIVGLFATFRISRFFFPPPTSPRTRTKVIDAWAEAGKRAQEKSGEESSDQDV